MMFLPLLPSPPAPAPIPPLDGTVMGQRLDVAYCRWLERYYPRSMSVDQVWVLRELEEMNRNMDRSMDWQTRFYVLGPRPGSNDV